MKTHLFCFTMILSMSFNAQSKDELAVQKTILEFFGAFHQQDTVKLKTFANGNITMQSISTNREGKTLLTNENYETFLKNIASIPKEHKFEEKLTDFIIKIDGNMANAWTPYEFWYKGKFSHCGVNSFQLMKDEDEWKIIYLVDTRRRQDCTQKNPK